MRVNRLFFLALAALAFSVGVGAQQAVTASGMAPLAIGAAAARDKAVQTSLRGAVEQAVGTFLDSEATVQNYELLEEKIYSRSAGYVSSYEVVQEGPEPSMNVYKVTISALVGTENLQNDVAALGIVLRKVGMPRTAVILNRDARDAEQVLLEAFRQKGFRMVDPGPMGQNPALFAVSATDNEQARRAKAAGADLLIFGEASLDRNAPAIGSTGMRSFQTSLTLTAIWGKSGDVLATSHGDGKAAHVSESTGRAEALRAAANVALSSLMGRLVDSLSQAAYGGRWVRLTIKGVGEAGAEKFSARVGNLQGVKDVQRRSLEKGVATYDVEVEGGGNALAELMRKMGGFVVTKTAPDAVDGYVPQPKEQPKDSGKPTTTKNPA